VLTWYRRTIVPRFAHFGIGFLVIVLGVLPSSGIVSASAPPPTTLRGHVLKNLATMTRLAAVSPDQQLTLTVALRPSSASLLQDGIIRSQMVRQGTGSWLTPQQVGQKYGQPQASIDALVSYFSSFGLTASPPQPDHLSFQVHGTAAEIERALNVALDNYQDGKGRRFYATSKDPQLPANLAATVQAIFGLDNYPALKRLSVMAAGSPGSYGPSDMQTAYNVTPLYNQGLTGAGQTIGIIGCDTFYVTDLQTFESNYGLSQAPVTTVSVDGGASGSDPETALDLEWSTAIAKGSGLRFYGFPASTFGGCTIQGLYDAIGAAANENVASVISISLGACEAAFALSPYFSGTENELAVAAAQGQSVVVASGDEGAFPCGGSTPSVDYPASSAFVTAVGGTALEINGDGSYGSESAWGWWSQCGTAPACGSGGGVSLFIPKPSWQSQVNASTRRAVPDVALNADPDTGDMIYFSGNGLGWQGGVGGTSIAAPQWAGIAAIANQAAGRRLGLLNPLLYSPPIVGSSAYHDVTSGNNLYYYATPGYDLTTGWGSPNAYTLVHDLVSSVASLSSGPATSTVTGTFQVFLPIVMKNACAS
jgi:subtilase family serine protease